MKICNILVIISLLSEGFQAYFTAKRVFPLYNSCQMIIFAPAPKPACHMAPYLFGAYSNSNGYET